MSNLKKSPIDTTTRLPFVMTDMKPKKPRTTDITAKVSSLVPGTGDSIETDE